MSESEKLLAQLSKLIRSRREEFGISQTELAEKAGLHRTYINNIERGTKNISIESLKKITDTLGISMGELILEAEEAASEKSNDVKILLVEDNPADVFMFKRCLKKSAISTAVEVIDSGNKAHEHLGRFTEDSNLNSPDIIFLDLNLPGRTGLELLQDIKTNTLLKHVPVIILTTSANPKDVAETYGRYGNSFLTKPVDPLEYEKAIENVLNYWCSTTSIPKSD